MSPAELAIDAVSSGAIKRLVGKRETTSAPTMRSHGEESTENLPGDTVILTVRCGKYAHILSSLSRSIVFYLNTILVHHLSITPRRSP